jgi:hypothetical protein
MGNQQASYGFEHQTDDLTAEIERTIFAADRTEDYDERDELETDDERDELETDDERDELETDDER